MDVQDLRGVSDVIDVDDLMRRCLGNIDFANRILSLLTGRCEEDLAELECAIDESDCRRVGAIAHRLKGASASGAAHGLSRKADELCLAAAAGSTEAVTRVFHELRDEWDRLSDSLATTQTINA